MPIRLSNLFLRTLREDPAEAEVESHKLLLRAGYIRRAAPGVYTWLPLGLAVKAKVEQIVREEMANAGAQEVFFPALLPREPFEVTGRWTEYGDNLFRLQDRKKADYLLAPTHEEMFTLLVKDMYSSYKDLPVCLYQIQNKYRDEARPRAGLLRGREFVMKDAYSFDVSDEGLERAYQAQRDAYERIFTRLGVDYVIVKADAGAMGGSASEEFLSPSPIGEDTFVRSPGGYAANVEAVVTPAPPAQSIAGIPAAVVHDSPNTPTIATLVALANDPKPGGFKGIKYFVDPRVVEGTAWITGANQDQKHVFDFVFGRDFEADGIRDIAEVKAGDPAPDGSGPLELARGIEIGHVFQLGRKYAEALDLKVLDENGKLVTVTMGSYGIGVTRIIAVLAEANRDEKGLIWPESVSPADVYIVAAGKDDHIYEAAEKLAAEFEAKGKTVILDDRQKVSPGVKFSDAELIGVPHIVICGRGLENGEVDLWDRRSGERRAVGLDSALQEII